MYSSTLARFFPLFISLLLGLLLLNAVMSVMTSFVLYIDQKDKYYLDSRQNRMTEIGRRTRGME